MTWYHIDGASIDLTSDVQYVNVLAAAEITVKHIMLHYPPPYHLMVSGGIDSQAMMYMWKLFGRNFVPTAVKYNNDLNQHDLETLPEFGRLAGLEIQYLDFDLIGFYNNRYDQFAEKYQISSPHFGAHLGMSENLPGTVIFSGDFIQNVWQPRQRSIIWPGNLCLYTASKTRNIVPYFFIHTPELAYSYLYESLSRNLPCNRDDLYLDKADHYRKFGLPVIMQKQKYTGFERVKDYFDEHYKDLVTSEHKIKYRLNHSRRVYDLLLRYPYEKRYGAPVFVFKLNQFDNKLYKISEKL